MTWQVLARREATAHAVAVGLRDGKVAHRILMVEPDHLGLAVGAALDDGFTRLAIEGSDPDAARVIAEVDARRLGRQTDLAMIVGGGESDLMRTFAAVQTLDGAIDRIVDHTPYLMDAGRVEGKFGEMVFVNSVAAGVLSHGPGWFPWWPWPILAARPVSVRSGGSEVESVASGMLVLNGQFWGSWVAAPRSTVVDGVLDVQMFNGHRIALSRLRRSMRTGMHVRSHYVRRRSLGEAEFRTPDSWTVAVDGIRVGRGGFRVSCIPGAVRLAI